MLSRRRATLSHGVCVVAMLAISFHEIFVLLIFMCIRSGQIIAGIAVAIPLLRVYWMCLLFVKFFTTTLPVFNNSSFLYMGFVGRPGRQTNLFKSFSLPCWMACEIGRASCRERGVIWG